MRLWKVRGLDKHPAFATVRWQGTSVVAGVVATFVTLMIWVAARAIPSIFGNAEPEMLLDLFSPLLWLGVLLASSIFGLFGALLFLVPSFALAYRLNPIAPKFATAGLLAGAAHAVIGTVLAFVSTSADWEWIIHVQLFGGFMLASSPPIVSAPIVLPASMIGGWLAGMTFDRLSRRRHKNDTPEATLIQENQ